MVLEYQYITSKAFKSKVSKQVINVIFCTLEFTVLRRPLLQKTIPLFLNLYHNDNVFLQFEIENKSGVRFDFDYLKIFKVNGNQKRNASYQELPLEPVYIHNRPSQILPNTKVKMVYVIPKFTIAKNEKIAAQLHELGTTRKVIVSWR